TIAIPSMESMATQSTTVFGPSITLTVKPSMPITNNIHHPGCLAVVRLFAIRVPHQRVGNRPQASPGYLVLLQLWPLGPLEEPSGEEDEGRRQNQDDHSCRIL